MDAVKFIKERDRLCDSYKTCSDCPLNVDSISHCDFETNDPEKLVELVELWSMAHPPKTMLQDFLEKYPNALIDEDGEPFVCPADLGYPKNPHCDCGISYPCMDCWNRPVEW